MNVEKSLYLAMLGKFGRNRRNRVAAGHGGQIKETCFGEVTAYF